MSITNIVNRIKLILIKVYYYLFYYFTKFYNNIFWVKDVYVIKNNMIVNVYYRYLILKVLDKLGVNKHIIEYFNDTIECMHINFSDNIHSKSFIVESPTIYDGMIISEEIENSFIDDNQKRNNLIINTKAPLNEILLVKEGKESNSSIPIFNLIRKYGDKNKMYNQKLKNILKFNKINYNENDKIKVKMFCIKNMKIIEHEENLKDYLEKHIVDVYKIAEK